ncbi:MAG: hypothetical protein HWE14_03385 [Flavobacteriia bacterium]|nr:hypothetical protein [Flavobacteriia bacterium]
MNKSVAIIEEEHEGASYDLFYITLTTNPMNQERLYQIDLARPALDRLDLRNGYCFLKSNFERLKIRSLDVAYDSQQNMLKAFNYRYKRRDVYRLSSSNLRDVTSETHRVLRMEDLARVPNSDAPRYKHTLYFGKVNKHLRFSRDTARLMIYNKSYRLRELREMGYANIDKERLEGRAKIISNIKDLPWSLNNNLFRTEIRLTDKWLEPYVRRDGEYMREKLPWLLEFLMEEDHISQATCRQLFNQFLPKVCQFYVRATNKPSPFIYGGRVEDLELPKTLHRVHKNAGFKKSESFKLFTLVKQRYLKNPNPSLYAWLKDIVEGSAYREELIIEMPIELKEG